ncbi:MAG TPA: STAS domain-containing protein [Rubricoccaceae bacterium]|jgi:anti-sigma B factor antagonist
MTITQTTAQGVTVLALDGDALGGPDGSALLETLRALDAPVHAVADLGGVGHMNSSGLGMLVGAMTNARNGGGDLRLARVTSRTELLLRTTRLLDVFQTFDSVDAAVESFLKVKTGD